MQLERSHHRAPPAGARRARAFAIVVLAVATSSACQVRPDRAATTEADSAGVTIVTNLPGSMERAPSWSLSAEPVLEIGAEPDGEVTFFRITTVVPLPAGGVAVGTATPAEVRIFSPDGAPRTVLGRQGEGPGEFWTVTSVVPFAGDSMAVWDQNRRRLSLFTAEGSYVRDVGLGDLVVPSPEAVGSALDPAASSTLLPSVPGTFVLFGVGSFGPGVGLRRVEAPSYRVDRNGGRLGTFGPFPGVESFYSEATGVAPYPFGASTYGATLGDTLVVGTAADPELRFHDSDGRLFRMIRWPDRERAVGGAMLAEWTEWLDAQLAAMAPADAAGIRSILDQMPPAERFPAYRDVVASDVGELWVGDYPGQLGIRGLPGDPPRMPARRWLVFASEGKLVGMVTTPEGFQLHAVHEGRLWGVHTGELDVESVRAYRLAPR